jgi:hypothetical protein
VAGGWRRTKSYWWSGGFAAARQARPDAVGTVSYKVVGPKSDPPDARSCNTVSGAASLFEGIGRTGPVTEFTPLSFAGNDDGDVVVFLRYAFTVTATGTDVAMNLRQYFRFCSLALRR